MTLYERNGIRNAIFGQDLFEKTINKSIESDLTKNEGVYVCVFNHRDLNYDRNLSRIVEDRTDRFLQEFAPLGGLTLNAARFSRYQPKIFSTRFDGGHYVFFGQDKDKLTK